MKATCLNSALAGLLALCLLHDSRAAEPVHFRRDVAPLFARACGTCHGASRREGGLRLDLRQPAFDGGDTGPAIVPGHSDQSELIRRITSADADERMPAEADSLSAAEIELLRHWIDTGADWPESDADRAAARDPRLAHWSFQPLQPVAVPIVDAATLAAVHRDTVLTDIDRFLLAKLATEGQNFAPPAEPRALLRRLSLDLWGLPPSSDELAAFQADPSPTAYDAWVETLLASPRYGERWAQHWLDVVRYADTHGFEVNTPREHAWPYRDYVIRAFNEDKPYDRFLIEQLAGDALDAHEATGFLVASAVLLPGQIGADEPSKRLARQDALDEMIVGTGGVMLGLTIGCARCHDHKFDPLTQEDYYGLQAFFAGVEYNDRPVETERSRRQHAQAEALLPRMASLEASLRRYESPAATARWYLIDEADAERTSVLQPSNGPGENPPGTQPGYKDDPGAANRLPNLSRGRYTWWNNVPGQDVLAYRPGAAGTFQLWISWGVHGSGAHTRDARYLLDRDGNPATRDDQQELARINQHFPAGVSSDETPPVPLWSGLSYVGQVELGPSAALLVRGGETGTALTADVILLAEASPHQTTDRHTSSSNPPLPRLRPPVSPLLNVERFAPTPARYVRFSIEETVDNDRHEPCLDELEIYADTVDPHTNLALAQRGAQATSSGNYSDAGPHQLPHIHDGQYGNDHSWISNQRGGGWVHIELPQEALVDRVVWSRDRNAAFQDRLALHYRLEVSRDGQTWLPVASSADRVPLGTPYDATAAWRRNLPADAPAEIIARYEQLARLRAEHDQLSAPELVFAGTFREPDDTFVLRRGDAEQRLAPIGPTLPRCLPAPALPPLETEQARRLALARWIASPNHPLTARVLVNRLWQQHFGRGLVETPNDFGLNGARPSHPELLDWLASEFIASGWSIKHVQRLIVRSAVYRQSSRAEPSLLAADPDNRSLAHFPSRRLEAEAIRDCLLAVSGELNLSMGGPGFDFFKSRGGLDGFPPIEQFGPEGLRRMIYAHKVRMERVPVFGTFDCPDAGQSVPQRSRSTTPLQALNLFNSPFVLERAEHFAQRIRGRLPADAPPETQTTEAFNLALGRPPSPRELAAATPLVQSAGLAALGRVLFNSNEFLFLP